jgi:rare lipoprotein A
MVIKRCGTAVWYGPGFYHKKTASGERLDSVSYTAAHQSLPFNTMVRVINLDNNDTVIVRINDRGPFRSRHCIDLSRGAAKKIGLHKTHTARVRLERVIKDTL